VARTPPVPYGAFRILLHAISPAKYATSDILFFHRSNRFFIKTKDQYTPIQKTTIRAKNGGKEEDMTGEMVLSFLVDKGLIELTLCFATSYLFNTSKYINSGPG
jgi:hypothetical protein